MTSVQGTATDKVKYATARNKITLILFMTTYQSELDCIQKRKMNNKETATDNVKYETARNKITLILFITIYSELDCIANNFHFEASIIILLLYMTAQQLYVEKVYFGMLKLPRS